MILRFCALKKKVSGQRKPATYFLAKSGLENLKIVRRNFHNHTLQETRPGDNREECNVSRTLIVLLFSILI